MLVALSSTDPLSHPSVLYLPFVHSPVYRLFTICLFLYPSLHQLSLCIPVHLLIDLLPSPPAIFHLLTAHPPLIYASIHLPLELSLKVGAGIWVFRDSEGRTRVWASNMRKTGVGNLPVYQELGKWKAVERKASGKIGGG